MENTTIDDSVEKNLENPNDRCKCGSLNCRFEDLGGYAYPVIRRTCLEPNCGKVAEYTDLYR